MQVRLGLPDAVIAAQAGWSELSDESKVILASWWEDATVSGMEREPGIRRFETEGDECS